MKQLINSLDKSKLYYLASPYRGYSKIVFGEVTPDGLQAAYVLAAVIAGKFAESGVFTFSPIAHSHPIAKYSGLDATIDEPWYSWNVMIMKKCDGMIVSKLEGWDKSNGTKFEIEYFEREGKPVYYAEV